MPYCARIHVHNYCVLTARVGCEWGVDRWLVNNEHNWSKWVDGSENEQHITDTSENPSYQLHDKTSPNPEVLHLMPTHEMPMFSIVCSVSECTTAYFAHETVSGLAPVSDRKDCQTTLCTTKQQCNKPANAWPHYISTN